MEIRKAFFTPNSKNPEIHSHTYAVDSRKDMNKHQPLLPSTTTLAPFGFVVCFRRNGNRSSHTLTPHTNGTRHRMDECERVGESCAAPAYIAALTWMFESYSRLTGSSMELLPAAVVSIDSYYESQFIYSIIGAWHASERLAEAETGLEIICLLGKVDDFRRKSRLPRVGRWSMTVWRSRVCFHPARTRTERLIRWFQWFSNFTWWKSFCSKRKSCSIRTSVHWLPSTALWVKFRSGKKCFVTGGKSLGRSAKLADGKLTKNIFLASVINVLASCTIAGQIIWCGAKVFLVLARTSKKIFKFKRFWHEIALLLSDSKYFN